jgi:ZIP family zinc transporter
MLAASTIGLIVPAFQQTDQWWLVTVGVMAGALFLNVLDLITPHLHTITGLDPEEHKNNATLNHVLLFVMAIALHKLPEGMAAGVSMCSSDGTTDWGVSVGIAIQNIPEGMVIIAPLLVAGVSAARTFGISIAIGLLEIIGVLIGFALGTASEAFLPVMLGFAGGAMLYVTSDEMIPETHTHGYQKQATYALLLGFMTMLLL